MQLGVLWYSYFGELWTATVQMTQHPKLQNVDFWRQNGPKRGPQTKIWQLIWNQGPKISMIPNFEGFTLNNKNFKNWPFGGPGAKAGAQNQIFSTDMKLGPQNECYIKFWRFYDQKQKFQNFDLSGARGAKRGPRSKIFPNTKLRPQNLSNLKCLRS